MWCQENYKYKTTCPSQNLCLTLPKIVMKAVSSVIKLIPLNYQSAFFNNPKISLTSEGTTHRPALCRGRTWYLNTIDYTILIYGDPSL